MKSGLLTKVERIEDSMIESECAVHGFTFKLAVPDTFNPYTTESMELAGFTPCEQTEDIEGFFYLTDEYKSYLADLIKEKGHHPANIDNRLWIEAETDNPISIDERGVCCLNTDIIIDVNTNSNLAIGN